MLTNTFKDKLATAMGFQLCNHRRMGRVPLSSALRPRVKCMMPRSRLRTILQQHVLAVAVHLANACTCKGGMGNRAYCHYIVLSPVWSCPEWGPLRSPQWHPCNAQTGTNRALSHAPDANSLGSSSCLPCCEGRWKLLEGEDSARDCNVQGAAAQRQAGCGDQGRPWVRHQADI